MTDTARRLPADWRAREAAVDMSRSCIVQAPAGSGKTELLVQRILALLAVAEKPEEILAITFTRKAAGEMRVRLLQALDDASSTSSPAEPHSRETWTRARLVLARDHEKGWNLPGNPSRLQLTTIDSFCSLLTRRMPWMSRFGESAAVTDDPEDLYRQAAGSLLAHVESSAEVRAPIEALLGHLDNQMTRLRDLVVTMLGKRDQWLRHLVSKRGNDSRKVLEDGLRLYVDAHLQLACATLGSALLEELRIMAAFAAGNLAEQDSDNPLTVFLQEDLSAPSRQHWLGWAHLVLTADGKVRKNVTRTIGFPAGNDSRARDMKSRMQAILQRFQVEPRLADAIRSIRSLPASEYSPSQWKILEAIIELLPLAVIELRNVFRTQGQVDFIEVAGAAHAALGPETDPEDLLLQLDSQIRHILVDEFQDTSYSQYNLLSRLVAGWVPGDGRTLFVVGDPMQSIYRFREADVGLYLRVCQRGLNDLPMEPVHLTTNFRSSMPLVNWVNDVFITLFPEREDELRGAVFFSPAEAFDCETTVNSPVSIHSFVGRQDVLEAETIVDIIQRSHVENAENSIAVLARSRSHLKAIAASLKKACIPFQAQDIEPLIDRPIVRDIVALARAIQCPADRIAWLSVLRAPWCGLTLDDLTLICDGHAKETIWTLVTQPKAQAELFDQVSDDGRNRLDRIMPILGQAISSRGRLTLRQRVESAWIGLFGPSCTDAAGLEDAKAVFHLLDNYAHDDSLDNLEKQLEKLYASVDPTAGPGVQLMTIHKAKGLEFDTVILPGIGRGVRGQEKTLLRWLEHPDYELLLAPVPPLLSEETEPTYQAIGDILKERDDLEVVRLLYVAMTRARSRLHISGHVNRNSKDELAPLSGSLLSVLWPALAQFFTDDPIEEGIDGDRRQQSSMIRRLPLNWTPPTLPESVSVNEKHYRTASEGVQHEKMTDDPGQNDQSRVVGILVHEWLEKIAREGLDQWTQDRVDHERSFIKTRLHSLGVASPEVETGIDTVCSCLKNSINSERGQWLLSAHAEAFSELSVSGFVDGVIVRATVDRTFVDESGFRWVVDYKTSQPVGSEDVDTFLGKEVERYRQQLVVYAKLLQDFSPQQPLKVALFFPAIDAWVECTDRL